LQYALDVSERHYRPSLPPVPSQLPDDYLKHQLLAHQPGGGLVWQTDLPFADVSVVEGGIHQKIILTDDDLFFRAWSAKDAHAYLPALLEQKNWAYLRAYSRNWWAKRAEELERLGGR
jgi:hypothetical protein